MDVYPDSLRLAVPTQGSSDPEKEPFMSTVQNKELLKDAITALPIPELGKRLGLQLKLGDNRSPLRDDDKNASFSIYAEGRRAKDHGTDWEGDSFNFYCDYTRQSTKQAFVPFVELAGLGHRLNGNRSTLKETAFFNWDEYVAIVSEIHLGELASWRTFGLSYCRKLVADKLIGRYEDRWAFPVIDDHGRVIGCHYLEDPVKKRWKFEPSGNKSWPLVLGCLSDCAHIDLSESTWDGLALHEHFPTHAVIVTRGAQHASKIRSIEIPKNAKIYVWAQNDQPKANGTIPSEQWFEGVQKELTGQFYRVRTPAQYADPNAWIQNGATLKELQKAVEGAELVNGLRVVETNGKTPHAPELTEAERVALLEPLLPPVLVWERDWYAFEGGFWKKTDRDIYRPFALQTMPKYERTARKAKETLDHLEGLRQLSTDCFRDANRFDGEDILLNLSDGVLRIRLDGTTALESASKEHFFSAQIPCVYDKDADAPLFTIAVMQALPDPADQELFLLWCASILFPSSEFETALCCYGPGGTGKSTLATGVQAALGPQVTRFLTLKEICSEQGYHVPQLRRAMVS
jgi:hypothetical protein